MVYSARVPTRYIIDEIGDREAFGAQDGAAFTASKLEELASGLRLTIDGEATPLTLLAPESPTGLGDRKFLTYDLSLTAPLPPGERHELSLSQLNYPDEHSYFMAEVLLDPLARVEACSLFRIEEERARFSRYGQWRMEEELREVSVSWTLPATAPERWARERSTPPGDPLPATELVARGELERLARGELSRVTGGLAVLVLFGLGALVWLVRSFR